MTLKYHTRMLQKYSLPASPILCVSVWACAPTRGKPVKDPVRDLFHRSDLFVALWAPDVILTTKSRQYLVVWLKYGWSWIWTVFCRQKVVVNGWLFFNCFLTVFCLLNVGASKNQIEKSMWSTVIVKLFRGATSIICVSLDVKLLCTKNSSRNAALKIESPSPLVKETKLRH